MSTQITDLLLTASTGAVSAGLVSVHLPAVIEHLAREYEGHERLESRSTAASQLPPRTPPPWVTRLLAVASGALAAVAILPFVRFFLVDGVIAGAMAAGILGACVVDACHRRLPNTLMGLASVPALYIAARYLTSEWNLLSDISVSRLFSGTGLTVLTGLAITALTFAWARFTHHLGMGDAKLTGVLMLWLVPFGATAMVYTLIGAGILAIVGGLAQRRRARSHHASAFVPLGPPLGISALACALLTAAPLL